MDKTSSARSWQLSKLQVNSMINKFIEDPEFIVEIKSHHRVRENNDVLTTLCQANVVGTNKINRSNLTQASFYIVYEAESDDVFSSLSRSQLIFVLK